MRQQVAGVCPPGRNSWQPERAVWLPTKRARLLEHPRALPALAPGSSSPVERCLAMLWHTMLTWLVMRMIPGIPPLPLSEPVLHYPFAPHFGCLTFPPNLYKPLFRYVPGWGYRYTRMQQSESRREQLLFK